MTGPPQVIFALVWAAWVVLLLTVALRMARRADQLREFGVSGLAVLICVAIGVSTQEIWGGRPTAIAPASVGLHLLVFRRSWGLTNQAIAGRLMDWYDDERRGMILFAALGALLIVVGVAIAIFGLPAPIPPAP